jgi:hypothetical protein
MTIRQAKSADRGLGGQGQNRDAPANPTLDAAIEKSRQILTLPPDWDDEGAQPISEATWRKATGWLREFAKTLLSKHSTALPAPKISPCADGSIDLLWRTEKLKLLVNIQPSDEPDSDFYGETTDGLKIKGTFRPGIHGLEILSSAAVAASGATCGLGVGAPGPNWHLDASLCGR